MLPCFVSSHHVFLSIKRAALVSPRVCRGFTVPAAIHTSPANSRSRGSAYVFEGMASPAMSSAAAPITIAGFKELENKYAGFLIDLWGVLHDGIQIFPYVPDCIAKLRASGKLLVFLSNSSRGSEFIVPEMRKMSIDIRPGELITSGDLVRSQIRNPTDEHFTNFGRKVFSLGRGIESDSLEGLEANRVEEMEAADYVLMTFFADEGESVDGVVTSLEKARRLNLPLVCPNADVISYHGDSIRLCPGHFAQLYESMGGTSHYYGKPHSPIYQSAFEHLRRHGVDEKSQVVMVGDALPTDICGASRHGIDSVLLASGIHQQEMSLSDSRGLEALCAKFGATPTYVASGLRW